MSRRALVCGERKALLVQSTWESGLQRVCHTSSTLSHLVISEVGPRPLADSRELASSCRLGSVDCMTKLKSWSLGRRSCGDQPRKCLPTSGGKSFTFQIILRKQASILLRLQITQSVTCRKMVRTRTAWWEESCGNHQVERVSEVHTHVSCSVLITEDQRSCSFCFSKHAA